MFFQLTLLACLLVGSQSAFQPAAHHPRQPFAAAPAFAPAAGPVAHSAEQPSVPVRQLPATSFKCSDKPYIPGIYADEETQCQVYHYCTPGFTYSSFCGEGTAFNQKTLTCDYPQNFTCSETSQYYSQTAGMGVETGVVTPEVQKTSFTCKGKPFVPGFYANMETGCQVYHMCVDDQQFDFRCGQNTVFSQELLTCTYANEVNCQQSPSFYNKNEGFGKALDVSMLPPFLICKITKRC